MKIKEIKDPIVFVALKHVSRYLVNEVWQTDLGTGEVEAEFKLAKERSKRYKEDLINLSKLDLDLNWGQKKTVVGPKSWYISAAGDFNPWYDGETSLNNLLDSLESIVEFEDAADNNMQHAEFVHYFNLLKDYLETSKDGDNLDFWSLIHKDIARIARTKFNFGMYADSVRTSLVEVEDKVRSIVKKKTGRELSGDNLMRVAFSLDNPVIVLDDLRTQSGKDIQKGYMDIFAGAMVGIRNPKSHRNFEIDRNQAIHFLFLASLLMRMVNISKVIRNSKRVKTDQARKR